MEVESNVFNLENKEDEEDKVNISDEKDNPKLLVTLLQSHYRQQDKLPPLLEDTTRSIKDCYVRLRLCTEAEHKMVIPSSEENKAKQNEEKVDASNEKIHDRTKKKTWENSLNYDRLYTETQPIELNTLWNPLNEKTPHHIYIEGEAGSGKSTLSKRMAWSWASEELWAKRFQWLLLIPLRQLNDLTLPQSPNKESFLWQQITERLSIPQFTSKHLEKVLRSNTQKGLLILDGWDEVAQTDDTQSRGLHYFLKLISSLSYVSILLTSRPNTKCPYLQNPKHLRVIGFGQDDRKRYITQYFTHRKQVKQGKALLAAFERAPSLQVLGHIPLYVHLLCLLANEMSPKQLALASLSQLYQHLIQRYFRWATYKRTGEIVHDLEVFHLYEMELFYLNHLAWIGMHAGTPVLSVKHQRKALDFVVTEYPRSPYTQNTCHWHRILNTGLLQGGKQGTAVNPIQPVYFPHLTIQEYLAAYYLVKSFECPTNEFRHEEARRVVLEQKYNRRYQIMLPFMAGIFYQYFCEGRDPKAKGLALFWSLLNSPPRDLTGLHHACLIMRCLEEVQVDTTDDCPMKATHTALLKHCRDWLVYWLKQPLIKSEHSQRLASVLTPTLRSVPQVLHHPIITKGIETVLKHWKQDESHDPWENHFENHLTVLAKCPITVSTRALIRALLDAKLVKDSMCWLNKLMKPTHQWVGGNEDIEGWSWLKTHWQAACKNNSKDVYTRSAFWNGTFRAFVKACPPQEIPNLIKTVLPHWQKASYKEDAYRVNEKILLHALPHLLRICLPNKSVPDLIKTLLPHWQKAFYKEYDKYISNKWIPSVLALFKNYPKRSVPDLIKTLLLTWRDTCARNDNANVNQATWTIGLFVLLLNCPTKSITIDLIKTVLPICQMACKNNDKKIRYFTWRYTLTFLLIRSSPKALPNLIKTILLYWQDAYKDKDKRVREAAWEYGLQKLIDKCPPTTLPDVMKIVRLAWQATYKSSNKRMLYNDWRYKIPEFLDHCPSRIVSDLIKIVLPLWQDACKDENNSIRRAAWENTLPSILKSCPKEVRLNLMKIILPLWTVTCKNVNENIRKAAWKALPEIISYCPLEARSNFMKTLIPIWSVNYKYMNEKIRESAWKALPMIITVCPPEVWPDLIRTVLPLLALPFKSTNEKVRGNAWHFLYNMYAKCPSKARPNFMKTLLPIWTVTCKNINKEVRKHAWKVLPSIMSACTSKALPDFMETLIPLWVVACKNMNEGLHHSAWEALPAITKYCPPKIFPKLMKILLPICENNEFWTRRITWGDTIPAILKACPTESVNKLIKNILPYWKNACKDKDSYIRIWALTSTLPAILHKASPKTVNDFKEIIPLILQAACKNRDLSRIDIWTNVLPVLLKKCPHKAISIIKNTLHYWQKDINKSSYYQKKIWEPSLPILLEVCEKHTYLNDLIQTASQTNWSLQGLLAQWSTDFNPSIAMLLTICPLTVLPADTYQLVSWPKFLRMYQQAAKQQEQPIIDFPTTPTKPTRWQPRKSHTPHNTIFPMSLKSTTMVKKTDKSYKDSTIEAKNQPVVQPLTYTRLHTASKTGDIAALKKGVIEYGIDINDQSNPQYETPLIVAVKHGKWQAVKFFLEHGAEIDRVDAEGKNPSQLVLDALIKAPLNITNREILQQLLKQRTYRFPAIRIEDAIHNVLEQHRDPKTHQPKRLDQADYQNAFHTVLPALVGEEYKEYLIILSNHLYIYRMAMQDLDKVEQESETISERRIRALGEDPTPFLFIRIRLLFEVVVELYQAVHYPDEHLIKNWPKHPQKGYYNEHLLYTIALSELQCQLTTLWHHRILLYWHENFAFHYKINLKTSPPATISQAFFNGWVEGIIHQIHDLQPQQEIALPMAWEEHSVYIAIRRTNFHYCVRVDNLLVHAPKTPHTVKNNQVSPYLVAYFPEATWAKHTKWLFNYLKKAAKLYRSPLTHVVINHLYQINVTLKPPRQGDISDEVKQWPTLLRQTINNCFMRSHNVGFKLRLGAVLYDWFQAHMSANTLFNTTHA